MNFKMVFLPPHDVTTRSWATRLAATVREAQVVVAETIEQAREEIADADAAFGTIPPAVLERAGQFALAASTCCSAPGRLLLP